MNYGKINTHDIANGSGVRVSLFVSGCRNRCKGCFQPETWDFNYGQKMTTKEFDIIYKAMSSDHISGLSILGGEPLEPENLPTVTHVARSFKIWFPNKTIWLYTGFLYEDIKDLSIMKYLDIVVDGRFIEVQKDISLTFKGSKNQRIIDVQKSRELKKVVLWEGDE